MDDVVQHMTVLTNLVSQLTQWLPTSVAPQLSRSPMRQHCTTRSPDHCPTDLPTALPQESERLHREVLAWKERTYGPRDIRTCTTVNSLGSLLRKRGELAEAETLLRRAMEVREAHPQERFDAAVSRDELACTLQAAGRTAEAREVRLRAGPDGLICSNARCSKTPRQAGAPLRCCSRCHAIWYCGPTCQRADWANNHKRVCRAEQAAAAAVQ